MSCLLHSYYLRVSYFPRVSLGSNLSFLSLLISSEVCVFLGRIDLGLPVLWLSFASVVSGSLKLSQRLPNLIKTHRSPNRRTSSYNRTLTPSILLHFYSCDHRTPGQTLPPLSNLPSYYGSLNGNSCDLPPTHTPTHTKPVTSFRLLRYNVTGFFTCFGHVLLLSKVSSSTVLYR